MKVLVAYYSLSGNTKKVAEAIFDQIEYEKEILPINEISNFDGYDIIFAGFPVWSFQHAQPADEFFCRHAPKEKKIALFVTHARPYETEDELEQKKHEAMLQKCRERVKNENLAGFFHCRGELSEKAGKSFSKMHSYRNNYTLKPFKAKRNDSLGHPDADELEVARIFTRDVMSKVC